MKVKSVKLVPAEQELGYEAVVYNDTDSLYINHGPHVDVDDDEKSISQLICVSDIVQDRLNNFYTVMARRMFNIPTHRLNIKGELVLKTAFWTDMKKRYAMILVYELDKRQYVDHELLIKGMDVVRSSFPARFAELASEVLRDILMKVPKADIDKKLINFKTSMESLEVSEIARNTSIKDLSKYEVPGGPKDINHFKKYTTAHAKACLIHNRLLALWGLDKKYPPIRDGDKIKYVYLKNNKYNIKLLAFKGYEDAPQITEFVEEHLDHAGMFDRELKKKIQKFYDALGWGLISTEVNQNFDSLFEVVYK